MIKHFLWALPLLLGSLTSCQSHAHKPQTDLTASKSQATITLSPFAVNQDIAGKMAVPIKHEQQAYWLLSSETQGLLLTNEQGHTLSHYQGNMEVVAWRDDVNINGKQQGLIATVEKESGQILILGLDWQNQAFSLLKTFTHGAAVETLCWYTLPQGHNSLFIADEQGQVTQRLVLDATSQQISNVILRDFVGVPEVKSCAVDQATGDLYLVESNIGVWRYAADPEAELQRDLIAVTGQFGQLQGEVTSVAVIDNGELIVTTPEQQALWLIDPKHVNAPQPMALPKGSAIESASVLNEADGLRLGLFDDKSGLYQQAQLKLKLSKRKLETPAFAQVLADAQTTPVATSGDAADDPAIWLNSQDPGQSRILATNKKRGLLVHDLQGKLVQQLDVGRVNNVDLRYAFTLNNQRFDLAAASNRTNKSISLFAIEPSTGQVSWLQDIATDLNDTYGLCMYQAAADYYVFINDTDGRFQQYLLTTENGVLGGKLVREFKVASQPEGCVADDQSGQLYFGEEAVGIWQVPALPTKSMARLIAPINNTFVADVEGMAIYQLNGQRFLIASSQGNNSYGVFALDANNRHVGSFQIAMNLASMLDGVSETDGLDIISVPLGETFPDGLLVVQDGHNIMPSDKQNFKLVSATRLRKVIESWLN